MKSISTCVGCGIEVPKGREFCSGACEQECLIEQELIREQQEEIEQELHIENKYEN